MILSTNWTEYKKNILYNNIQRYQDIILPSEIELNIATACTRTCSYCPSTYERPEQAFMDGSMFSLLLEQLMEISYSGAIEFCGRAEPLTNPQLPCFIRKLQMLLPSVKKNIFTNGDLLTKELAVELDIAGTDYLLISMYDGPEQIEHFKEITKEVKNMQVVLRDRYTPWEPNNRAGYLNDHTCDSTTCNYPFYFSIVDYNGDVTVCPHDFLKKLTIGNITQTPFIDIWKSNPIRKTMLENKRKDIIPCKNCDVNGTVLGTNSRNQWKENT